MTTAFPLQWPDGWPRTPSHRRSSDRKFSGSIHGINMGRARDQLLDELRKLGVRNAVISTNISLRNDGLPYASQRKVDDPGVAAYFTLKGKQLVMAQDQYDSVAGNMRSLALAIDGMRQLERHGGGAMMERAFQGFAALTAPDWKKPWRHVFGVGPDWCGDINAIYREKAKMRHPDSGGSDQLMAELNVAYQEARSEDITDEDANAEGCGLYVPGHGFITQADLAEGYSNFLAPRQGFEMIWRELHGEKSWDDNPEVVAISFKVIKRNIDAGKL